MVSILASRSSQGSIPGIPKIISEEKIIGFTEVNQWRSLEENGQWLENVDRTHLELASGKPVLQKSLPDFPASSTASSVWPPRPCTRSSPPRRPS